MSGVTATCPWCGFAPVWQRKDSPRSAEGEAPMRALGCDSIGCAVQLRTKWRNTQEFRWASPGQRQGYFDVDHDADAVRDWNQRHA